MLNYDFKMQRKALSPSSLRRIMFLCPLSGGFYANGECSWKTGDFNHGFDVNLI